MSDLAERFARSQGYECDGIERTTGENCPVHALRIDVSILPIIWADCKAKGWHLGIRYHGGIDLWHVEVWRDDDLIGLSEDPDPIAALCEAYCKAKEAME